MNFRILAINPGSTSTKIAVYDNDDLKLELKLDHTREEIAQFHRVIDQLEWRKDMIFKALEDHDVEIHTLSAVIGRGGLMKPIESGVYEVNDAMWHDLIHTKMEHASNLGALIARELAEMAGVKAYVADPVVVDEMEDIARISGLPECPRRSIFHALNQKSTARLHCERNGLEYEKVNLIVAHMGGGCTVSAHRKGRVIDTTNAMDGDGSFSPERAGALPAGQLVELCFSGRYTEAEIKKMLAGRGGMVAHIGTNSVIEAVARANAGDAKADLILRAMCYNVAKQIGMMAAVLSGEVDAIILTGGVAHNRAITDRVASYVRFIAPVHVYPGENEMAALKYNAMRVLTGRTEPKIYR